MLKIVLGVIVGYAVLALLIFVTFTLAYLAMGAESAFQPGSYQPSALWLAVSFALGLIASIAAGFICVVIAKNAKAPLALAGLVVVLGLLLALPILLASESGQPQVREGNVGNLEAMQNAKQPAWVMVLNPFIGAAGVLLGARLKGSDQSRP
jgi:hypothetical protein